MEGKSKEDTAPSWDEESEGQRFGCMFLVELMLMVINILRTFASFLSYY
jgi:hypothetical protein